MKKLLMIFGSIGIMGIGASMIVACTNSKLDGLKATIQKAKKIIADNATNPKEEIKNLQEVVTLTEIMIETNKMTDEQIDAIHLALKLLIAIIETPSVQDLTNKPQI
ncbi:hypothetical protein [Williamsoniiplasma luminosum]|uniref:Lipoprotein n=1 Tax=Williamsoniiplasma luminosum TaxID=214888 RepID=A0A2S0NJP6_9MOLU|nr:hypothetical protein [Williamsoniiplasma luminosum]AVP49235.1 MAG: hypothetical protein C5T88_01405 [Williamsoniiplasma luminosum]